MICQNISCDCGHLTQTYCVCTICDQIICDDCTNINSNEQTTICNLCVEHKEAVDKLFDFIELNIIVLENIEYNSLKYLMYKDTLQTLQILYNIIISFDSITFEDEVYNYLSEPEIIYNLIKKFTNKLYYIYNNSDNFLYAE